MAYRTFLAAVPVIVGLLTAPQGRAQSAQPRPEFGIASIKLNTNCQTGKGRAGISPGRLDLPCVSLPGLIRMAYSDASTGGSFPSRRIDVVGGPAWLDSDRYDISAKTESAASQAQITGPMLRALLEERYQVKVHRERRDTAVYALTVAKISPRLQPSKEGSCTPMDLNNLPRNVAGPGQMPKFCGGGSGRMGNGGRWVEDWYGVTMAEFAGRMLTGEVDRPVIDKTELGGRYDIHLEFIRDDVDRPGSASVQADVSGPSIFAALEDQLGLKLSPARSPVDVIVVDRAEKPSAN